MRVHILSAVNSSAVSKTGDIYTIRGVCGAVDEIVMNGILYPGDQLKAGVASLNQKPAPAGHPRDEQGRCISALNGAALASAWIGSYCTNARHEGGRTQVDIVVKASQAKAHPDGAKLIERLDSAIAGTNADPIHVSTGLNLTPITANGESNGKKYGQIATNLQYDHLAILLNEKGAGTPEDGVGMFLNSAGVEEEIQVVHASADPEDRRSTEGLKLWIQRLIGNANVDASFDTITSSLHAGLPEGAWIRDVFDRYAIWTDKDGQMLRQDYAVGSDGSVAFSGMPVAVKRQVSYEPITNSREVDPVKEHILAALNAAGIAVAGLDDTQLLSAYNSVVSKPHIDKLTAANSAIAGFEAERTAAQNAERDTLATELAVNSSLTVDDLKALPVARLRELKAKAAPVLVGNAGNKQAGDEFDGYDMNKEG